MEGGDHQKSTPKKEKQKKKREVTRSGAVPSASLGGKCTPSPSPPSPSRGLDASDFQLRWVPRLKRGQFKIIVRLREGKSAGTKKKIREVFPCCPNPCLKWGSTRLSVMCRVRVLQKLLSAAKHGEVCNHAFIIVRGVEFHTNVLSTRAPLML